MNFMEIYKKKTGGAEQTGCCVTVVRRMMMMMMGPVMLLMKEMPFLPPVTFLLSHGPQISCVDVRCMQMGGIPVVPYMAAEVCTLSRLAAASLGEGTLPLPPLSAMQFSPSPSMHACMRGCKHC